jgi:hypothetical protein
MTHTCLIAALFAFGCASAPPPPPAVPVETRPAPAMTPPLALGDARITVAMTMQSETHRAEIVIAPDGAMTSTSTITKNQQQTTTTTKGRITAAGELHDDTDIVVAKIDGAGVVLARSAAGWTEVGTISADGSFQGTDGKALALDDAGKVSGLPSAVTVTVTAGTAQKKLAMFAVMAMFAAE